MLAVPGARFKQIYYYTIYRYTQIDVDCTWSNVLTNLVLYYIQIYTARCRLYMEQGFNKSSIIQYTDTQLDVGCTWSKVLTNQVLYNILINS